MFDKIFKLKQKGYEPAMILDIGAYKGTWTSECLRIFNNSEYRLFEAIDYPELKSFEGKNMKYYNVLLNDKVDQVEWFEGRNTGDLMFCEKSKHFVNCQPIKKETKKRKKRKNGSR